MKLEIKTWNNLCPDFGWTKNKSSNWVWLPQFRGHAVSKDSGYTFVFRSFEKLRSTHDSTRCVWIHVMSKMSHYAECRNVNKMQTEHTIKWNRKNKIETTFYLKTKDIIYGNTVVSSFKNHMGNGEWRTICGYFLWKRKKGQRNTYKFWFELTRFCTCV